VNTLHFPKAQPVDPRNPVESLTLVFDQEEDSDYSDVQDAHHLLAVGLADALWDTVSGGFLDSLIAELMRRRASLLVVRHTRPAPLRWPTWAELDDTPAGGSTHVG
jgi:hypothetical protein